MYRRSTADVAESIGQGKDARMARRRMLPYRISLAGSLLAAREAVMAPIRPYLRDAGVTEQQWRVLRVLSDEGPLDFKTLADRALLHAPSVTRIIKELADRGLILRMVDEDDKRRSILSLTRLGRDLVVVTAQHTLDVLDTFGERFGRDRLATLRSELRAFAEAIGVEVTGEDD